MADPLSRLNCVPHKNDNRIYLANCERAKKKLTEMRENINNVKFTGMFTLSCRRIGNEIKGFAYYDNLIDGVYNLQQRSKEETKQNIL